VAHEFKTMARNAGLPHLTLHGLRHGAATIMLSQGVSLKTVQEILGHSTYYLTANVYGHVAPELSREAANAMDRALAGILAGKGGRGRNGGDGGRKALLAVTQSLPHAGASGEKC
jgi:hypothetical protein